MRNITRPYTHRGCLLGWSSGRTRFRSCGVVYTEVPPSSSSENRREYTDLEWSNLNGVCILDGCDLRISLDSNLRVTTRGRHDYAALNPTGEGNAQVSVDKYLPSMAF